MSVITGWIWHGIHKNVKRKHNLFLKITIELQKYDKNETITLKY